METFGTIRWSDVVAQNIAKSRLSCSRFPWSCRQRSCSRRFKGLCCGGYTGESAFLTQSSIRHLLSIQACFLFNSDRWKAQESILLIAAVGDYWEFSAIERKHTPRNSGKEDDAEWSPKTEEIEEIAQKKMDWSGIAKYGSVRSGYHEAQVIEWVNAEYPNP
jgi:hypothetical protein